MLVYDVLDGCKFFDMCCFGELLILVKVGVIGVFMDMLVVG